MGGMSARCFSPHPASGTHSSNAMFLALVDHYGKSQNSCVNRDEARRAPGRAARLARTVSGGAALSRRRCIP
jgi:hypothetical protein